MSIALIIFILRCKRVLRTATVAMICGVIACSATMAQDGSIAEQDYQLAAGYYQKSDWSQSAASFEDFVSRYPDHRKSSEANFFLAESKIQLGNYADALIGFQTFIAQHPNHRLTPRATFRMGEAAFQLGKGKIALKSLELFIKKYPQHALVEYAMPYLGELRLGFNEPKLAQRAFSTALKMFPDSELADQNRYGLAQSYRMLGKKDTAARYWKFVATENDSDYAALAKLQLGILACENGRLDEAQPYLATAKSELAQEDPEHRLEANYWLGRVALEKGQFEEANSIFTNLESLPADENCGAGICYDAAVAAWKTDREDLAIEWLAKLRSTWPTNQLGARAMALEIELLRQRGLDAVVADYCKQFAERFPKDDLRFNVTEIAGRIHHKEKKFALGVKAFDKLLTEHSAAFDGDTTAPDQRARRTTWLYLKGLCHIGLGEFDTAIRELRLAEANMVNPDSQPQIELAIATSLMGQQLYYDASVEFESYLEKAEPEDRENVMSALSRLVVCYGNLNRWEDADEAINVLLEGDRETGLKAIQFVSDHAYEKKRFDVATRYYKTLAMPENESHFRNQGLAGLSWLMMETNSAEANEVFQRLVDEYPDSTFSSRAAIARAKFLEGQDDATTACELYRSVVARFSKTELAQIARLRLAWFNQQAGDVESLHKARAQIEVFLQVAEATPADSGQKSLTLVGEALYQLGWVNHDLGETEASMTAFSDLVATRPESKYWPDAAYRVASSMLEVGEFEHASEMVKKILAQQTVPPEVKIQTLYLQSKVAAESDRWDEVPDLMQKLIDSSNDETVIATAKYWKAEALYRYGDFDGAGLLFDEMQPNATLIGESLEPWLLLRLAQCHGKSQRWTNAAMLARDCLERFEGFSNAYEFRFLLGRAAEYDGMFDDARNHYLQVIESTDGAGTETAAISQWRIGETYFHQNKHKEAIAAYSKTNSDYSFSRWSSAALIQAGKCQEHLGNWQHAATLYAQLLERHPESEFVADAKERLGRVNRFAKLPNSETKTH
ncbi:tetratricopeptide repeat protein [Mariniblastus fucicola]|uniref:Tol-pal system protein YbgF n=1 Tax=Mariniblastus fucicola TaxID=980251 RepID=A0A5B9P7I9_9BACT|nr:tetratricopeptide repeat protein [Mariniblastus fucicola]QEG20912.1 tol-pal system protein YbgF [Mariniblastus fucicola]